MRVNHRRAHIFVTEKFLNSANVVAVFEQVRREGVPERMTTRWLVYAGFSNRCVHDI